MSLASKTIFKLKLFFTEPKKFFQMLWNVAKVRIFPASLPLEGQRFTTDLEVETLKKYSMGAKFGIVEIGILDGATTKEMAKVSHVPIYGIDPLIPDSMNKRLVGHEEIIKKNLDFYPEFSFIKDFSYNVAKRWDKKIDFIFIDGDHTYEAVRKDFEDWLPLIEQNGYIAFHDSAPVTSIATDFEGWEGPVKLVSELKANLRVEFAESKDSITVFKKK